MTLFCFDPLIRAPLFASMLMSLSSALIGILIFFRKRALLAETLAHATYPGVALALLLSATLGFEASSFILLIGAFISALTSYYFLEFLHKRRVKEDSALTFVLAVFFGLGVTVSSFLQFRFPVEWQQVHAYLYGQIATMDDVHILIYGLFSLVIVVGLALFFKEIKSFLFDRNFSTIAKMPSQRIEAVFILLSVLAVVISMRAVGLVLISAMLIAPAVFARAFTDKFSKMFILAGAMALLSAAGGNFLSLYLSSHYGVTLPIGPTIVLVATGLAFLSLLFAPKRGLILRYLRIVQFRSLRLVENLLKLLWRLERKPYTFLEIAALFQVPRISLFLALFKLRRKKAIEKRGRAYVLTPRGIKSGARIIRLHRLWEVYLVDYLGVNAERVHKSAEEIEHILTPELEKLLMQLLKDPKRDPHNQPIPPEEMRDEISPTSLGEVSHA